MKVESRNHLKVFKARPFTVEQFDLVIDGKAFSHPYFRLNCPDWVNVLPVTEDNKAILIRQPRAGVLAETLEVPGGELDDRDDDPAAAAARELEEETGYRPKDVIRLGQIHPNPAIIDNKVHFFLATGCHVPAKRTWFPDNDETIKVELVPVQSLETMIRGGEINHCLSALCCFLASNKL